MQAPERLIRHSVVRFEQFLPTSTVAALYEQVLALEPAFIPSFTQDHDPDVRRSFVLNPPAALVAPVVERVKTVMPQVLGAIRLPPIEVADIEAQVTANTDGSYFNVHTDADYAKVKHRYLTYVYYFNGSPKGFDGGELRVYDDTLRHNKLARADSYQSIEPAHNSIVFFWARAMHEVQPVCVPSRAWRDSRFTVNGWVNAKTDERG